MGENIYWTGGFDSTFLVCKRLIIEKKPIETYYLNFPCDGYQHNYNRFDSSNIHNCIIDNEINAVDNYPYGRKTQYPITSSVSLEFLVSGFATGEISSLIASESGYDFDIQVIDTEELYQNTFSFEGLKLENSSYQMGVNGNMNYSLGFSFEITN